MSLARGTGGLVADGDGGPPGGKGTSRCPPPMLTPLLGRDESLTFTWKEMGGH